MGGFWYKLDNCYRTKRRWTCARGCGARIHTCGKRVVFSGLRHRFQIIYNTRGYPKLVWDGYTFRAHNVYRNHPKVLWYCSGRGKYHCPATVRTFNRELISCNGVHNHAH
ncbi:unnamed protein product [Colias eurytheme]|nr:unnamed protein product [Colias eurytheme]